MLNSEAFGFILFGIAVAGYLGGMPLFTEVVWGLIGKLWVFLWDSETEKGIIVQDAGKDQRATYYASWPVGLALLVFLAIACLVVGTLYLCGWCLYVVGHSVAKRLGVAR